MNILIQTVGIMPFAMLAGILCGLLIAVLLVLFGILYAGKSAPGKRFKVTITLGWAAYLFFLIFGFAGNVEIDFFDIMAGAAVLLSATVLGFVFWSLIVWGFTLNMLLSIAAADGPITFKEWIQHYLGDDDVGRLTSDRMEILLAANLVHEELGQTYHINPRGNFTAKLYRLVRALFGLSSHD